MISSFMSSSFLFLPFLSQLHLPDNLGISDSQIFFLYLSFFTAAEPLQSNFELEEDYCRALLCRLRFRKVLTSVFYWFIFLWNACLIIKLSFQMLTYDVCFQDQISAYCEICSILTSLLFFQHFYHVLTSMRRPQGRGLELARKHIASCLSELDLIRNSSTFLSNSFGINKDGLGDMTTASGRQPLGFDSSLNCRLSAPTPPRAIKLLSWKKVRKLDLYCRLNYNRTVYHMTWCNFLTGSRLFCETASWPR